MNMAHIRKLATSYTAAWSSQTPARVAAHYSEGGWLKINGGTPSVGRAAIIRAASDFMTALPDMVVSMEGIGLTGNNAVYRWTLFGTNTGPGGSGKTVHISGYEEWTIGSDGLILKSKGHFDQADYDRQLSAGSGGR